MDVGIDAAGRCNKACTAMHFGGSANDHTRCNAVHGIGVAGFADAEAHHARLRDFARTRGPDAETDVYGAHWWLTPAEGRGRPDVSLITDSGMAIEAESPGSQPPSRNGTGPLRRQRRRHHG